MDVIMKELKRTSWNPWMLLFGRKKVNPMNSDDARPRSNLAKMY